MEEIETKGGSDNGLERSQVQSALHPFTLSFFSQISPLGLCLPLKVISEWLVEECPLLTTTRVRRGLETHPGSNFGNGREGRRK